MGGKPHDRLDFYRLEVAEALGQLESGKGGLDGAEAAHRLEEHGPNRLAQIKKDSWLRKYFRQYRDLMIILLLVSSFLAFTILDDSRTGLILFLLVLFNTIIGFTQEFKAEKLMESLEKLVVSTAKVRRGGKMVGIDASQLVPGDIVYIEEGDSVPADLRLIEETELATNDFAMTGESQPSRKFTHAIATDVELANRHNLVFMGTTVATGNGYGVVIGTGMQTELGRIASLSQSATSGPSPLQKEMNNIAKRVTQATAGLFIVLLLLAFQTDLAGKEAFLFAVGIAASLVPNGLPAAISTVLAQAASQLARSRALVKKLSAVETLGATSIICTDKTGTLTKNEMTAEQLFIGKTEYKVTGSGYIANGHVTTARGKRLQQQELQDLELFFATGPLASNARVSAPDDQHAGWYVLGDPTEGALITLANKAGLNPIELDQKHPELKEFAFDSARKRMSSVRQYGSSQQRFVFAKGAPENILERCDDIWDHGHVRRMSAQERTDILALHEKQAAQAMRNLALAYRILPPETSLQKLDMETAEDNLVYLGMVSMIDPVREEVAEAMTAARAANIRVSIITGDFATTAKAIAIKAKLVDKPESIEIVAGEELRHLSDEQVISMVLRGGVVFSRVSPEDKLRIVGLVKSSGKVVAVTGDGINDAPALKTADIGVAMGITGTDVAKQSAEIVLLDDSFHTLVSAVQQGRVIFANIKKIALMCFVANASELVVNLFSLGGATLLGIPLALSVLQILAIDLIAELFPVAALGWDQADHDLMKEQPRNPHDHILNRSSVTTIIGRGLLIGGLAYGNYLLFFYRAGVSPGIVASRSSFHMKAMALTYLTIVLCQWINILHSRSQKGFFTRYQFHNKKLWIAFAASALCVLNIIYNPAIAPYFNSGPLTATDWLFAAASAGIFLVISELQRHSKKHGHTRNHVLSLLEQKI
ncbi:MAG TPA: cation-transporting P-type ATPase [Candidatus Limnocylindria bacterium]|nr:cation-transporting P-type ATPase [Candidatus Limnocylindria bacterium]